MSTDEVYGEVGGEADDLIESSLLAPTNPYSASKAAAEMLVNAYWKSWQLVGAEKEVFLPPFRQMLIPSAAGHYCSE